ncbi:MAG: type II secretion system protein [Rhodospirillales bacterium]
MTEADPRNPETGFTLLEVLIAFTVVAFVLAAVMQIFSGGLRSTAVAEQRVFASMLAQSKIEEMAAKQPLHPVVESGATDNGYRWRAEVSKYWELASEQQQGSAVVLYQLAVTVEWGPRTWPRRFDLATLRVGWPEQGDEEGGDPGAHHDTTR